MLGGAGPKAARMLNKYHGSTCHALVLNKYHESTCHDMCVRGEGQQGERKHNGVQVFSSLMQAARTNASRPLSGIKRFERQPFCEHLLYRKEAKGLRQV